MKYLMPVYLMEALLHFLTDFNVMINIKPVSFCIVLFVIMNTLASCEKDLPPNPYNQISNPLDTLTGNHLDPNSIAGLHKNIFKPTCSNSGCHDGTFEPDYRTIESTYNTLVYQPVIKNDTLNTYEYRVFPGKVGESMLYIRLIEDLNGNSGIMPLEVDPGSDWLEKKEDYIKNIVTWIENGAKDILGNAPVIPNKRPQMLGITAMPGGGNMPFARQPNGAMIVPPASNSIDIWVSLSDDETATPDLLHNKIRFSLFMNDFDNAVERELDIVTTPLRETGYEGAQVDFYHRITINPYDFVQAPSNNIFIRVYVKDTENDITEIPATHSETIFKTYFTLILDQ